MTQILRQVNKMEFWNSLLKLGYRNKKDQN